MDENQPEDARQSLFDEFESEIVKAGNAEAFFDENDLIEIFDYATDLDNYIVKMEVLLYGARHYPDSEALATRRAWFYSSFGEMEAAADVNSRVFNGGVLNKLLDLRAKGATNTPETRQRLDEMIDSASELGDEDVIQLVDFCAELGMLDWVAEARKRVEAKTSYPQTFIYEYADRAEEAMDYPTAIRLFEELTMMEPFTLDFWLRLATVQHNNGDFEPALTSADFALAISPDAGEALRVKASSLFRLGREAEYVIDTFRELVKRPEASEQDIVYLSYALYSRGDKEEAVNHLVNFMISHPGSRQILDCLLTMDLEKGEPFIRDFSGDLGPGSEAFVEWALDHLRLGNYEIAAAILSVAAENELTGEIMSHIVEACYLSGRYGDAVKYFEENVTVSENIWIHYPSLVLPYVMSLVRLDRRKEALAKAREFLNHFFRYHDKYNPVKGESSPFSFICQAAGYQAYLRNIINALEAPSPLPADDFDPLKM